MPHFMLHPLRYMLPILAAFGGTLTFTFADDLEPLRYGSRGPQVVDLGVGLWAYPLPVDFDGDGDFDLLVSCPDKPYNGTYFFENRQGNVKLPVFERPVRLSDGYHSASISHLGEEVRLTTPAAWYPEFRQSGLEKAKPLGLKANIHANKVRANQWKFVDYDADDRLDLLVGVGDWTDYGWDDAYNPRGQWTNGPLHGYVYLVRNTGTTAEPQYTEPRKPEAGGAGVDVYGMPSPNLADFDGDGDLDLLCGEFLDGFTYFQNEGTRAEPRFAAGRRLQFEGKPLTMDLQMIVPTALDWDRDGDVDLIVGDEDGRVALVEHTGALGDDGLPRFLPPVYFQQRADALKCGALATPCGFDWDGDGDDDILCGNTAGYLQWFENLGPEKNEGGLPSWAAPRYLEAGGERIRIQAGPNGSIQGPCEAKWGYTTLTAADWDGDTLPDLLVNSIWGKVIWYRNTGARTEPKLAAAEPVRVAWPEKPPKPAWNWWDPVGGELVTQWRTTPVACDWNRDGLTDLVLLDHEGYLCLWPRSKTENGLQLAPGWRVFVDAEGEPLQFNAGRAGKSGRRKLCVVDWDGDGRLDVLANSENAEWWRNMGEKEGRVHLVRQGNVAARKVSGHTSSPTTVDFNGDGVPELLVGAEDGHLYYLPRP